MIDILDQIWYGIIASRKGRTPNEAKEKRDCLRQKHTHAGIREVAHIDIVFVYAQLEFRRRLFVQSG